MSRTPQWIPGLLLPALVVAGCANPPNDAAQPLASGDDGRHPLPLTAEDGRDLRAELAATDRVAAPVWQVGERFRHHVYFGTSDGEGEHYDSIVVEDRGDAWLLATDDRMVAKQDAIVDIPILGDVQKSDLTMSGFGEPWDFYQFPLHDGASWEMDFPNIAWDVIEEDTVHLFVGATFAADIETPDGPRPGFRMEARTAQGQLIAEYDYVPAIGWYAHFTIYDIDPDGDPIEFRVTSMGHDYGWSGTYYADEARPMLFHFSGVGVDPDGPGEPFVEPGPTATFTMSDDSHYLVGILAAAAAAGVQELALVSPAHEVHHWEAVGAPVDEFGFLWEAPAEAGEWRLLAVGAGAVAIAYAELYEVIEHAGTL